MNDRPLAKYEDGRLWLDVGFPDYVSASRFQVMMKREIMRELLGEHAARKAAECSAALKEHDQYQAAMEEAK